MPMNIEEIEPRTINGNPITTIISHYSLTHTRDEKEVAHFYECFSSFVRLNPNHISDTHKFAYDVSSKRNGIFLEDFIQENNLVEVNLCKLFVLWVSFKEFLNLTVNFNQILKNFIFSIKFKTLPDFQNYLLTFRIKGDNSNSLYCILTRFLICFVDDKNLLFSPSFTYASSILKCLKTFSV